MQLTTPDKIHNHNCSQCLYRFEDGSVVQWIAHLEDKTATIPHH